MRKLLTALATVFLLMATVFGFGVATDVAHAETVYKGYGYSTITDPSQKTMYEELSAKSEDTHISGEDVEIMEFDTGDGKINHAVAFDYDFASAGLTLQQAQSVWATFRNDNPQYYWLSGTLIYSPTHLYIVCDSEYASASERARCNAIIASEVARYTSLTAGLSTKLDKALAVHDDICNRIAYAYKADGITPSDDAFAHNVMGVFENRSAVCEGYAKAYQLIMTELGIDSIYVTGISRGVGHSWNMVKLDDGLWHWVDVTWDDPVNIAGYIHQYFGLSRTEFASDHTPNTSTPAPDGFMDYLYPLPTVSDQSISLTKLYKDGSYVGCYDSVSSALAGITDANGSYKIELLTTTAPHKIGGAMPKAKRIDFVSADNYGAVLTLNADVTFDGNVGFERVSLMTTNSYGINVGGNTVYVGKGFVPGDVVFKGGCSVEFAQGVDTVRNSDVKCFPEAKRIKLPSSVSLLGNQTFMDNTALEYIEVADGNRYYKSVDGVLFSADGKALIKYPSSMAGASYSVPRGVTEIKDNAFYGVRNLTKVVIPYGVTTLGNNAFAQSTSLTAVYAPSTVTQVGTENPFANSPALQL